MKVTLAWLKEHRETSATLDEIAACLDRIAMLKHGIPDLRAMFSGDLRWLRHYGFSVLDVPTVAGGWGG